MSFLDVKELAACRVACKEWSILADDESLWRNLIHARAGGAVFSDATTTYAEEQGWKATYLNLSIFYLPFQMLGSSD